jgi:hypothetical protein
VNNNESENTPGAMRVILTGDGEWRGTFSEFLSDNNDSLSAADITTIVATLMRDEPWRVGGGAAPVQTLRRDRDAERRT